MDKIMMTWIEILHICLKMFGLRVMAVFAYLEEGCEVSRTLHGKLVTAKTRYTASYSKVCTALAKLQSQQE